MDELMNESGPSPRLRRKRAEILAAAEAVFLARGYADAAMDEIAAAANASKQTIYAHFGGKEALFLAMADAMIARAYAARAQAMAAPGLRDDVAAFLLVHARQQLDTARDAGLMRLRRLAIAEAERFPDFGRRVFEAGPGGAIEGLAETFAAWHRAGRLRAPDPHRAAETFNWLIMGGPTSEAMLLGAPLVADDARRDAHAAECVRVFLAAYGA